MFIGPLLENLGPQEWLLVTNVRLLTFIILGVCYIKWIMYSDIIISCQICVV